MPVGEFLNSKTMLTKILLTYYKAERCFLWAYEIGKLKIEKILYRPANAIEQK